MIVKARSDITLTAIVDIVGTTRYYKLATSLPAKPTTNPPSGWTTTEPAYTAGGTSNLYITDMTLYSDGTWSYSDVSMSSSYEAAREAYNKANSAQTSADGKNTVYYSAAEPSGGTYASGDIWFDTDNGNAISIYDGTAWVTKTLGSAAVGKLNASNIDAGAITANECNMESIQSNIVEIGNSTSKHIMLSSSSINFLEGTTPLGYLSSDKLYTTNSEVSDALYMGSKYVFRTNNEGKLVLGRRK